MNAKAGRIDELLQEAFGQGHVPGVVAAATSREGLIYEGCAGLRGLAVPQPMTTDTVFWIASMTKAITSVAALLLVERGKLPLDAPLGGLAPQLTQPRVLEGFEAEGTPRLRPAAGPVLLKHLLSHSSGFAEDLWNADVAAYMRQAGLPPSSERRLASLDIPLVFDPGQGWHYGLSHEWVGLLIERATGQPIDAWMAENIFTPLGMSDSGWDRRADHEGRRAGVQRRTGETGFEPIERVLPPTREYIPAGGALNSTVGDYVKFIRSFLNAAEKPGEGMISRAMALRMAQSVTGHHPVGRLRPTMPGLSVDLDFLGDVRCGWGLGAQVNLEPLATGRSAGSLSWGGLGNCYFWIDPANGLGGGLMTQILPFGDPAVLKLFAAFEREVYRMAGKAD